MLRPLVQRDTSQDSRNVRFRTLGRDGRGVCTTLGWRKRLKHWIPPMGQAGTTLRGGDTRGDSRTRRRADTRGSVRPATPLKPQSRSDASVARACGPRSVKQEAAARTGRHGPLLSRVRPRAQRPPVPRYLPAEAIVGARDAAPSLPVQHRPDLERRRCRLSLQAVTATALQLEA